MEQTQARQRRIEERHEEIDKWFEKIQEVKRVCCYLL